jgi:polysaccharide export outer membrane protein
LGAVLLTSCKTPQDITYLQDVNVNVPIKTQTDGYIRFQPGDKLSIYVHSRDEKLMELFNLFKGSTAMSTSNNNGGLYAYTIDNDGCIDFPVLGQVKVQGFTRTEVAQTIKNSLIKENLCKDPVVTVEFYNMNFSVLGTVGGAGMIPITKDKITILEAVAMASDLQIDGKRKNILVMRQEGDQQVPYRVDLTSSESIYNSPVYYIRQNDIVYVEPNDKNKRNSTVMGSSAYQPTFWMSLASFLTTMALIFIK